MTEQPIPQDAVNLDTVIDDLLFAIGQLLRRVRTDVNPDALTWSQTAAMALLERLGSATIADLARADAVKPQSMGATLSVLEQEELVGRRPHPTDGRQVLFSLTDKGIEARQVRGAAKRVWLRDAVARLDPAERHGLAAAAALIRRLGET
jgi:DNA-binding MarR family transcriptional regulator